MLLFLEDIETNHHFNHFLNPIKIIQDHVSLEYRGRLLVIFLLQDNGLAFEKVSEGFFSKYEFGLQKLSGNIKGFGSEIMLLERVIIVLMKGRSFLLILLELFLHEILLHEFRGIIVNLLKEVKSKR